MTGMAVVLTNRVRGSLILRALHTEGPTVGPQGPETPRSATAYVKYEVLSVKWHKRNRREKYHVGNAKEYLIIHLMQVGLLSTNCLLSSRGRLVYRTFRLCDSSIAFTLFFPINVSI